jgi:hypothetical protein
VISHYHITECLQIKYYHLKLNIAMQSTGFSYKTFHVKLDEKVSGFGHRYGSL